MLRAPTFRELLRGLMRHLPPNRMPCYVTGAIWDTDIPPAEDDDDDEEEADGGSEEMERPGMIVLKDDDDVEAWWCISNAKPMEAQVVLDSSPAGGGPSTAAADEMASILGVEGHSVGVGGVGLKRPRVDTAMWEDVLSEERSVRRRV